MRRTVGLYLVLTLLLSSVFWTLIISAGRIDAASARYNMGLMWSPGLAAFLTLRLSRQPIALIGWSWGQNRYQWLAYLIPLLYTTFAYGLIWSLGLGGFPNQTYVDSVAHSLGCSSYSRSAVIVWNGLLIGTLGVIKGCANTLGEEIGWRGLLVPILMKNYTYTQTSLLTGVIWASWHYPILLFANYNNGEDISFGLSLVCFTTMIVSSCFAYTWLRLKSGSVWTGVIFHSSHNLFIQSVFTPLTTDTGSTRYWYDEFGIVLALVSVVIGYLFWRKRNELPP